MMEEEYQVGDMIEVPFHPETLRNALYRRGREVRVLQKTTNLYYVWRTK